MSASHCLQLPMPGCLPLIAAILMQKFPGSVKLTCPENQCHIMRRLENWKHKDLAYQGYTHSLESNQPKGSLYISTFHPKGSLYISTLSNYFPAYLCLDSLRSYHITHYKLHSIQNTHHTPHISHHKGHCQTPYSIKIWRALYSGFRIIQTRTNMSQTRPDQEK